MKNFKYILLSICGLFLLLGWSSCEIEPEMTDRYSDRTPWRSESNMNLYLNTFYPLLSGYGGGVPMDCYTDLIKQNSSSAEENLLNYGFTTISPDANRLGNWSWAYSWIRTCNELLEGFDLYHNDFSEDFRNLISAQVRWFRAYVYFELAKRHGGSVILLDKLPTQDFHPRCEPDECWDFIASEFDFAAKHLPAVWDEPAKNKGRLTKGAAFGLKAVAMLYAERWQAASDACDSVKLLGYQLLPDYKNNFNNKFTVPFNNTESIIEFYYKDPEMTHNFDYLYGPPSDIGCFAFASPTEDLVRSYQMADGSAFDWDNPEMAKNPYVNRESRFYATILFNGADWKGRKIESFVGGADGFGTSGATTTTGYYLRKFLDETKKDFKTGSDNTHIKLRYAEILLVSAEAKARLGRLSEAMADLNAIRARAGFTKGLTAGSWSEFFPLLEHERKIELAFEGHRYWDLRRWGIAKQRLNGLSCVGTKITKNEDGSLSYEIVDCDEGNKRVYLDKFDRFPIPLVEIQRNPLCEQFNEWK